MTFKLPPMLEPDIFSYVVTAWRDGVECEIDKGPRYTVEQMEAYAREAVRLNMAPLSDEHVRIPESAAEAKAMATVAIAWLKEHAPDELRIGIKGD